jgi:hypothetical protein
LAASLAIRSAQDKELERQVKKYGEDELAPTLHAYDGMESSMLPTHGSNVDATGYKRAFVLKAPGEKATRKKKQEDPTYRLREHLFRGKKVEALNKARDGSKPKDAGGRIGSAGPA